MQYINAKVDDTKLGCLHERGIMTFCIRLSFDGCGQGFGGYCLDSYNSAINKRVQTALTGDLIYGILEALSLDSWEDIKGKYVRIAVDNKGLNQKILGIGHIVENKFFMIDKWLDNFNLTKETT